jgi:glycosyltransferase involved in cell wall biosynthesis
MQKGSTSAMKIGVLLPTVLASNKYSKDRIFAPKEILATLVNKLTEKGHRVFLYASKDISVNATVIPGDERLTDTDLLYYQFRYRDPAEKKYTTIEVVKRDFEYDLTTKAYKDALAGKLDIIHSYHDFGAHYFNELTQFPTVYTLHDPLPKSTDTVEYLRYSKFLHHHYISISNSQRRGAVNLNFVKTIYHGIDIENYQFDNDPDDYFIHFGRFIEDKGTDLAIQAALEMNISLRLATSTSSANRSSDYFDAKIAPFINNKNIVLEGYLKDKEKLNYISKAKAFIFPLRWDEPFGLTVIESMVCGTPVVTFNHGSMPELVKDGVSGFVVDYREGIQGIKNALKKIDTIDRKACRQWVLDNFTSDKMADNYLEVYRHLGKL